MWSKLAESDQTDTGDSRSLHQLRSKTVWQMTSDLVRSHLEIDE